MSLLPLALGAGALAAAFALLSGGKAQAAQVRVAEKKLAAVIPSRRRTGGGRVPLVKFTLRKVPWRIFKKKQQFRTQVIEDPRTLAAMASQNIGRDIPLTTFSLASMIASEAGSGEDLAKVAVAHAALTAAKKSVGRLHAMLTAKDGHYGSQQSRYASTRFAPTLRDVEIAEAVLSGKIANPAPGAIQWDSPSAQDKLHAQGEAGYDSDADALALRRKEKGKVPVYLDGVDPRYLRLWKVRVAA